jgi:hypothetical protein
MRPTNRGECGWVDAKVSLPWTCVTSPLTDRRYNLSVLLGQEAKRSWRFLD